LKEEFYGRCSDSSSTTPLAPQRIGEEVKPWKGNIKIVTVATGNDSYGGR